MKHLAMAVAVVLSVVNNGQDWRIQFTQSNQNVGVQVDINCKLNGKLVWANHPYADVDSEWSEVLLHRETLGIPRGASCEGHFQVMRNDGGGAGDTSGDYAATGESATITWVEK